jgi:zinc transport system ATP-binding protein
VENLLEAKKLNYKINGKEILRDVSLKVSKNDFVTIVGPNGAGKTSLLQILLGSKQASEGTIRREKGLKVGYVPQKIFIDYTMPINVAYFLKLCQKTSEKEFLQIVKETNIEKLLEKQMSILSGGEIQRVLLAKALLVSPDLLILDEPAQNLDISGQIAFYELLRKIYKKKKISILMVSHDLHMVMSATKNVICLFNHVCCSGEPNKVTKDPEFIAMFGDNMSKLISIYNHYHSHEHE